MGITSFPGSRKFCTENMAFFISPAYELPQMITILREKSIATIVSDADAYAEQVLARLRGAGLRAETDLRNEKINYKVREHSHAKVPVIAVVGRREAEEKTLALRRLGGAVAGAGQPADN